MKLHELESTRLQVQMELENLLEETQGEVTPEVDRIADRLLQLDMQTADKIDRYAYTVKSLESERDRLSERAMIIHLRAEALDKTVTRLKDRVKEYIERNVPPDEKGRLRVEGELHTVWVQNAGGKLPLEIDPEVSPLDVPPAYQRLETKFEKDAIRAVLDSGGKLSFAKLGERGRVLRIK